MGYLTFSNGRWSRDTVQTKEFMLCYHIIYCLSQALKLLEKSEFNHHLTIILTCNTLIQGRTRPRTSAGF